MSIGQKVHFHRVKSYLIGVVPDTKPSLVCTYNSKQLRRIIFLETRRFPGFLLFFKNTPFCLRSIGFQSFIDKQDVYWQIKLVTYVSIDNCKRRHLSWHLSNLKSSRKSVLETGFQGKSPQKQLKHCLKSSSQL